MSLERIRSKKAQWKKVISIMPNIKFKIEYSAMTWKRKVLQVVYLQWNFQKSSSITKDIVKFYAK